jgi:hypothetical protein
MYNRAPDLSPERAQYIKERHRPSKKADPGNNPGPAPKYRETATVTGSE